MQELGEDAQPGSGQIGSDHSRMVLPRLCRNTSKIQVGNSSRSAWKRSKGRSANLKIGWRLGICARNAAKLPWSTKRDAENVIPADSVSVDNLKRFQESGLSQIIQQL